MQLNNLFYTLQDSCTLESLRATYGTKNLVAYAEYLRTGMIASTAQKYGLTIPQLRQLHKELKPFLELQCTK